MSAENQTPDLSTTAGKLEDLRRRMDGLPRRRGPAARLFGPRGGAAHVVLDLEALHLASDARAEDEHAFARLDPAAIDQRVPEILEYVGLGDKLNS